MKKKIIFPLLIAAVFSGIFFMNRKNKDDPPKDFLKLNQHQLEAYLNIRGWKVTETGCETIRIPQKFSGSFKILSDEIKKSGFDLESHKGETVKRYTYVVDNYGEPGINAELLITDENELIGAALIQQKPDGFIKAL